MAGPDLLDGQAARPSASIPHHYVLDIPGGQQTRIHARCFRPIVPAPTVSDEAESSSGARRRSKDDASVASRAAESLELAWRKVNSTTAKGESGESLTTSAGQARSLLNDGPCAVVTPSLSDDPAALWYFALEGQADLPLDGLRGEFRAALSALNWRHIVTDRSPQRIHPLPYLLPSRTLSHARATDAMLHAW